MNVIEPAADSIDPAASPVKKACTKCGVEKALEEFYFEKRRKDGRSCWCKQCIGISQREFRRSPEYKKKHRAYMQRPERKKWWRAYRRRPEYKAWQRARHKQRAASDPQYRLARSLRGRLSLALKGQLKVARTLELLGCTLEDLQKHLESQFKDGMTWENYGEWHIDHIKPCASFDLTDPAQQRLCAHYTNLQPLWAAENISKGAKHPSKS